MSLNVLREAYMRHVSFRNTEEMSNQWGAVFYSHWARDNWWLSVSPPIEEDASPYKGCVAAKFLYEDDDQIVIRKITFSPEEASGSGVFWGSSDRINARRRTFIRSSLPSIIGEMIDSIAWRPDGEFDRPELIDKISGTYAAMMSARKANLEFTWHDSVMDAYRSWHNVSTSCMTGEDRYENTELYDNCTGGKRIWALEVRDASNTLIGRALVFKPIKHRTVEEILNEPAIESTDVPFKENAEDWYVHRIYGAGAYAGSDYDGARRVSGEIMKAYPWLKHEVSGVACIVCRIPRSQRLPYLDNHGFFLVRNQDPNSKIIICFGANPSETCGWEREGGGGYEGGFIYEQRHNICCSDCDERVDEEDATYVNDRPVCSCCLDSSYTWCHITEEYCSNEDAIEIVAGREAGSYIDMNCLPYTRRGVTYEIADTPSGRSVAAPAENIIMVFYDGEDKAMVLDSDDTENIMTAKVIRPAFDARGYLSSDFIVTDEEIDVLVDGSRSNYCWKDADDNWYVYRDGIPFNGVVKVVRDDDVVRFFTETGPRQIMFRPHGGRRGLIPLSMDFWEQTTPCDDVRVKPNWMFCITDPKDGVWHVSLTCIQFEIPNAHAMTANVRTSNLGCCIVNDDRSGLCRLLKVGMSSATDDWEIERICKSMFRSGRFGAGDYCIKHIPNTHEYEVTSSTGGHMLFGESKLIVNADSIMEVS